MSYTLALDSVRGGVLPFVERVEKNRRLSLVETREVLQNAAIPVFLLRQLCTVADRMIELGAEPEGLVVVLTEVTLLTNRCIRAFADLQRRSAALDLNDAQALADAAFKLTEIKNGVATLGQFVKDHQTSESQIGS
jgi:hypothetical protein